MAIQIDTPLAPTPPALPSLLATLKNITKASGTRSALANEFESAYVAFLSQMPTLLNFAENSDALDESSVALEGMACQREAARPPNQIELEAILKIYFEGEMETRATMQQLITELGLFKRPDLVKIVEGMEALENNRLKETIARDQLRRLAVLESGESDFTDAIARGNTK